MELGRFGLCAVLFAATAVAVAWRHELLPAAVCFLISVAFAVRARLDGDVGR